MTAQAHGFGGTSGKMVLTGVATPRKMTSGSLLTEMDPAPFEIVNPDVRSPVVLICEHAGRAVPVRLGDMGLRPDDMERHIAFDLGAERLARRLSAALDSPLVLQRYSRLVIDCNRPLAAPDAIPEVSDGTPVPANRGLAEVDRRARYDEIHQPFHHAVTALLDRRNDSRMQSVVVTLHSFTPKLGGVPRTCHLGVLYNRDPRLADAIMAAADATTHGLRIVRNAPYSVDDISDYTIPVHGEQRGLRHALLEVRNDLIADEAGLDTWTSLLEQLLNDAVTRLAGLE